MRQATIERDAEIARLYAEGLSDEAIGAAVGLKVRSVLERRTGMGLIRPYPKRISREYIAERFKVLGEAGIPIIAHAVGGHTHTVRRILRDELKLLAPVQIRPAPEAVARADEMLDGTIPYIEVAETVGIKRDTLAKILPGRGLKPGSFGAYRRAKELEEEIGL